MKELRKRMISASGFTLIELLLVIVIIGILAGVLIGVINPTAQQNKARDAAVRATINKMALATAGYLSAYGRVPDEVEFLAGVAGSVTDTSPATCATASSADCTVVVTGNPLPADCTTTWSGSGGAVQCGYRYCGGDDTPADGAVDACVFQTATPATSSFRIYAKAFGTSNIFMYRSVDSKMYLCNTSGHTCTAMY